jgi:hypothetical protein
MCAMQRSASIWRPDKQEKLTESPRACRHPAVTSMAGASPSWVYRLTRRSAASELCHRTETRRRPWVVPHYSGAFGACGKWCYVVSCASVVVHEANIQGNTQVQMFHQLMSRAHLSSHFTTRYCMADAFEPTSACDTALAQHLQPAARTSLHQLTTQCQKLVRDAHAVTQRGRKGSKVKSGDKCNQTSETTCARFCAVARAVLGNIEASGISRLCRIIAQHPRPPTQPRHRN